MSRRKKSSSVILSKKTTSAAKIVIKRAQSQACLGYAEREQFLERSEKKIREPTVFEPLVKKIPWGVKKNSVGEKNIREFRAEDFVIICVI